MILIKDCYLSQRLKSLLIEPEQCGDVFDKELGNEWLWLTQHMKGTQTQPLDFSSQFFRLIGFLLNFQLSQNVIELFIYTFVVDEFQDTTGAI